MLTCIFVNDYVKFCMMWWRAANDKEIPYHWNKAYGHVQTMWRKFYYSLCWHSSRIRISSSICTNLNVAVQPPSSSPVLYHSKMISKMEIYRERSDRSKLSDIWRISGHVDWFLFVMITFFDVDKNFDSK